MTNFDFKYSIPTKATLLGFGLAFILVTSFAMGFDGIAWDICNAQGVGRKVVSPFGTSFLGRLLEISLAWPSHMLAVAVNASFLFAIAASPSRTFTAISFCLLMFPLLTVLHTIFFGTFHGCDQHGPDSIYIVYLYFLWFPLGIVWALITLLWRIIISQRRRLA